MRHVPLLLCAIGLLAALFAYWSINTVAGRRRFDEMAGMIPMAVGVLGLVCLVVGVVWLLLRLRA